MVDVERVMRKLPSLLCNGSTTEKSEWARRHRIENDLKRLKKRSPEIYYNLENRLLLVLTEIEEAVNCY